MKYIYISVLLCFQFVFAQKDFSEKWEDLYSYNNVKDFDVVDDKLYAVTDNAMFIYNTIDKTLEKFSSVNGLVGENTSSFYYDSISDFIFIGYQRGHIDVVTSDNRIIPITGIVENRILVDKEVKGFYRFKDIIYTYGDFGIVELNPENFYEKNKYVLSNNTKNSINTILVQTEKSTDGVEKSVLYAATETGLYRIDMSLNPELFSNWELIISENISSLLSVEGALYFAKGNSVFNIIQPNTPIKTENSSVLNLNVANSLSTKMVVTTSEVIKMYETEDDFREVLKIDLTLAKGYKIKTHKAIVNKDVLYVNTEQSGVLSTDLMGSTAEYRQTSEIETYVELHPDGPTSNSIFGLTVSGDQKWIVYGGENENMISTSKKSPIDYYINNKWGSIPYDIFKTKYCTKAIVDPMDKNRVLVSTVRGGVLEFQRETEESNVSVLLKKKWNKSNTGDIIPGHPDTSEAFVGSMVVDFNNRIWTANSRANEQKYFSSYNTNIEDSEVNDEGKWDFNVDLSSVTDKFVGRFNKMYVDNNNVVYATSKSNSVLVFDANSLGSNRVSELDDTINHGALNSTFTSGIVVDENNKIWIGTLLGVSVIDDYENLFNTSIKPAESIIIEQGGDAREFLSGVIVNDILIDAANNKWFATKGAGVFYTSSDAQTTFNQFTTSNSPLPSNNIIDLEIDKSTGLVYMVTEKGTVVFNPETSPVAEGEVADKLTPIVAYPNPAIRTSVGHDEITFEAKDGKGIPDETNVKIIDVSGKLVLEANISNQGQAGGGKFVWDKKNLKGNSVVSGIYIVLFSNADGSENTITKVAIVN